VESVIGTFVVFLLLAALVLAVLGREERVGVMSGPAAIGVWFVYLVHADTVVTAAYVETGRVDAIPKSVAFVAGGVVIVAGFALFAWATRALVNQGDFEGLRARRLVTGGPYGFMRQPQNAGWALMLLGVAIAGRSLISLALVAIFVAFVALLGRLEARGLAVSFGDDYERWRSSTPALPFVPVT
jgi:protein-S-isoprenylcysteine O-methyltransferase Ste14